MKTDYILTKIKDIDGLKISTDEPMSAHTSFKIGGPADVFVIPETEEAILKLLFCAKKENLPLTVIGSGSNLLVSDEGIRGITLKISSSFSDVCVHGEKIVAKSGASLAKIASAAQNHSLSGFEFASGIPGSLGGAIYMNAGAYGGEMADVIKSVTYVKTGGEIVIAKNEDLSFSYRHSAFCDHQDFVILSAEIELKKGSKDEIKEKMHELNQKRKEKQPLNFPSAGSAFKRPEGYFAAKLIEDAGLKGFSVGGAEVSEKHSGFIINKGGATASDVISLVCHIKKTVKEKFGVELYPEIKFVGKTGENPFI